MSSSAIVELKLTGIIQA